MIEDVTKLEIDLLLKEFDQRSDEIIFYSQLYHRQTNFVYLYLSIIVTISSVIFSSDVANFFLTQLKLEKTALNIFYGSFLTIGIVIAYYFFSTIMDSLYLLYLNGSRRASIELKINQIIGKDVLIWDSKIIPKFYDIKKWQVKGWVRPNILVGIWIFLFFLAVSCILSIVCFYLFKSFFWWYFPIVFILTTFHIYQWIALNKTGINYIKDFILYNYGLECTKSCEPLHTSHKKPILFHLLNLEIWIPLLTFVGGFLMFLLLSIKLNAFWINSNYYFPLITIPTIFLGDSIILPIFNLRFFRFLKLFIKNQYNLKWISILLITCLILSACINTYLHIKWISDPYTGFMDVQLGRLSIAGWWHYWFSIFQTTLVFLFLGLWVISWKKPNKGLFLYGYKIWILILIFTSFSIFDFLIRNYFIFKNQSLILALKTDWSSLINILLSLFVLFIANIKKKKITQNKAIFI